jgi:hypothetical protein
MASTSTTTDQTPEDLLQSAVEADSVPQLIAALDYGGCHLPSTYQGQDSFDTMCEKDEKASKFFELAIERAVEAGAADCVTYLIEEEGVWLARLRVVDVVRKPSIALFEALLKGGWDFDVPGRKDSLEKGRRPIDYLTSRHDLVVWLLDHDVSVDGGENESSVHLEERPPMLLDTCARFGSVETFKLIHSRGAKLGRRTLHLTVHGAADMGVDPNRPGSEQTYKWDTENRKAGEPSKWMSDRAEMLRYLVDELHVDVNAMDTDVDRMWRYGTPLHYAAKERYGAAVVKWLLEKGADPSILSPDGRMRPEDWARTPDRKEVLEVFSSWKEKTGTA